MHTQSTLQGHTKGRLQTQWIVTAHVHTGQTNETITIKQARGVVYIPTKGPRTYIHTGDALLRHTSHSSDHVAIYQLAEAQLINAARPRT